MLDWLSANYLQVLEIASYVVAGATVALRGIAPLTKNTTDDSVLAKLEWLLAKLSLNRADV